MKDQVIEVMLLLVIPAFAICLVIYIGNGVSKVNKESSNYIEPNCKIEKADVDINVKSDGSIDVVENMKYVPSKEIEKIYMSIEDISNVELYFNDEKIDETNMLKRNTSLDNRVSIKIPKTNSSFNITAKYTLSSNCITKYKDLSVFEYNISSNYVDKMKNVTINVNIPTGANTFNIFDKTSFRNMQKK